MANPRAHLREAIWANINGVLQVVPSATVYVYQPGTTTPTVQTIYSGLTGIATLSNPITADSNGVVEFWLAGEQTVDLYVVAPGYTSQTVESKAAAYSGGP